MLTSFVVLLLTLVLPECRQTCNECMRTSPAGFFTPAVLAAGFLAPAGFFAAAFLGAVAFLGPAAFLGAAFLVVVAFATAVFLAGDFFVVVLALGFLAAGFLADVAFGVALGLAAALGLVALACSQKRKHSVLVVVAPVPALSSSNDEILGCATDILGGL